MSTKKCSCREKEYIKIFCDGTRREELDINGIQKHEPPLFPDGDIPLDLSVQSNRHEANTRVSEGQLTLSDVQSELNSLKTNSSDSQIKFAARQAKISGRRRSSNVNKAKINERRLTLSEKKMKSNQNDQEKIFHPLLRKIKKLLEDQVDIPNKRWQDQDDVQNKWYSDQDDQVDMARKWYQDQTNIRIDSQNGWCQNQVEQQKVSNKLCLDQQDQEDSQNKWYQDKKDQMYVPQKVYEDLPHELAVPWLKDELNKVDAIDKLCQDQVDFSNRWRHARRTQDNKVTVHGNFYYFKVK